MRPSLRLAAAALPGAALVLAACLGFAPTVRDVPSYFVPLRARTAEVLAGSRGAFWDPDVGCGEPYFANPQSGLLYPPAWLATVLPPAVAVGVEAGLHLAVLAVGCALLARRLGAGGWLEVAAGWSVVAAGPVLDAVGVLNNLDTVAWMPWAWGAALAGSLVGTAAFLALAFLAAEPQLAVVAAAVAVALAPRRRTLLAVLLAGGLVAVQALPFAAWVRGGDRGASREINEVVGGAVRPGELAALAIPGVPLPPRSERFVTDLTVPMWALVLGVAALFSKRRGGAGAGLHRVGPCSPPAWSPGCGGRTWCGPCSRSGSSATPEGWCSPPWSRSCLPRQPRSAEAAADRSGAPRWWRCSRWVAVCCRAGASWRTAVQGVAAGAALAGPGAPVAALLGGAALMPAHVRVLVLRPTASQEAAACLEAQREGTPRIYALQPSWDQLGWVSGDRERGRSLGWGYTALSDGRRTVRTFAPLQSVRLTRHLEEADRGPAGRWWLDALGARRVVAHHPVPGFPVLCQERGVTVFDNPQAWPEVTVVRAMPRPDQAPEAHGEVVASAGGDDWRRWRVAGRCGRRSAAVARDAR